MLPRAARRKDALRIIRRSSEQLQLPWLCPAPLRHQSQACLPRPIAQVAQSSQKSRGRHPLPQPVRYLATAAAEQYAPEDYIPFELPASSSSSTPSTGQRHWTNSHKSDLPNFDLSSIITFRDSVEDLPRRGRRTDGIAGDTAEMHATLHACLQLSRFERAAALLKRFRVFYPHDAPELLDAHNHYLRAIVTDAIMNRKEEMLVNIQHWFEVGMRKVGIEADGTSYALMIKSSLHLLHGSKRDRTIRRYWDLAKRADVHLELIRGPILTDWELGKLTEICPTDLFQPDYAIPDVAEVESEDREGSQPNNGPESPVRAADQKGLGLIALKESLSLFTGNSHLPYPSELEGNLEDRVEQYANLRQERLEKDAVQSAIDRWRKEDEALRKVGVDTSLKRRRIGAHLWDWHLALTTKLREELLLVEKAEGKVQKTPADLDRCGHGPFLRLVEPEKLAAITILSVMALLSKMGVGHGVKLARVVIHVGKMVQEESISETLQKFSKRPGNREQNVTGGVRRLSLLRRKTLVNGVQTQQEYSRGPQENKALLWSPSIQAKVGAILSSHLLDTAKIMVHRVDSESGQKLSDHQPVFMHTYKYDKGRRVGYVEMNGAMIEKLLQEPAGDLLAKHLPMVAKPRPWKGIKEGGFLGYPVSALRLKNGDESQRKYAEAAADKGDLDQMFTGLDVLGRTAWHINQGVFDIMLEAWNSGEAIANFAPEHPDIPLPPKPENWEDRKVRAKWYGSVRDVENKKLGFHSQRCFQNFQMEIAKAYRDETFYLPHNVDFRGRAYPLPPYLNQMGADNCRGLLMFREGKPLGPTGLRWLRIHLANVYGYDKASLKDREDFAINHLSEIYDSAANPLNGQRWWLKAEDPWQCLATCLELKNALDSPDPTQFVSHLPIHQDGSCNGLQHYAALGGDVMGAQQVNLEPGDRPSDVYTGVAELVKAEIKKDVAKGSQIAAYLDGKITRKVVKQTVMTNVYGVTFIGAVRQVRRQLEVIIPEPSPNPELGFTQLSIYIARRIFNALGAMFTGAHHIQYWLGDCATRISTSITPDQIAAIEDAIQKPKPTRIATTVRQRRIQPKLPKPEKLMEFRSSVIWTTPLKLPVVQPYRTTKARRIKTNLQDISIKEPHVTHIVNKRKQLQAFPPNFIHSLDATHMILSALKCDEVGLSFAAVHDSFWTHAADVDTMNGILRDAFIRMHSENIVGRLAAEFRARYKDYMYQAQVNTKSEVGRRITAHRRKEAQSQQRGKRGSPSAPSIVKNVKLRELLNEWKRQRLLASEDEAEREQGRNMVTPASIFEEFGSQGESQLASVHSLGQTAIGHIPEETSEEALGTALESNEDVDMQNTLSPLFEEGEEEEEEDVEAGEDVDADTDSEDVHVDVNDAKIADSQGVVKDQEENAKPKKRIRTRNKPIQKNQWLWLPLTFPEVPKKGEFDVSRLKHSQYFFS